MSADFELRSVRWTDDELFEARDAVFRAAPPGCNVDLEESCRYLKALPAERRWDHTLRETAARGSVLVYPRLGYGDRGEMAEALRRVRDEGGAGAASIHIDSYTRWHRWEEAGKLAEQGSREGRNLLNGYPIVHYGVNRSRELFEQAGMPLSYVGGSQDARLIDEMMIATGMPTGSASIVPPPFSYTNNKISLEQALWLGLYVPRLAAWYIEHGVPILATVRGCNCGTARPPSLNLALTLVEVLAAAEQGCRDFDVTFYLNSSFEQDLAYLKSAVPIIEKYVRRAGFSDCEFRLNGSHYDGVFPAEPAAAMAVLCYQALVGRLGGSALFHTKTLEEGAQLPTIEAHVQSCRAVSAIMDLVGNVRYPDEPLHDECAMLELEVDSLMDNMYGLGQGDILRGFVASIKAGTMEFPFSPSKYNAGEAVIVRDAAGAARFWDTGKLALPEESARWHRQKLEEANPGGAGAEPNVLELMFRSIRYLGGLQVVK